MVRKLSRIFGLCIGLLMAAAPVVAHHSISAEFDSNQPIEFTGVVKKVDWMNPHIYTHVEVKDAAGKVMVYRVEGGPPNSLFRNGWRSDSLKIGQTVTVKGIKARRPDSPNIGQATITTTSGQRVYGGRAPGAAQ